MSSAGHVMDTIRKIKANRALQKKNRKFNNAGYGLKDSKPKTFNTSKYDSKVSFDPLSTSDNRFVRIVRAATAFLICVTVVWTVWYCISVYS